MNNLPATGPAPGGPGSIPGPAGDVHFPGEFRCNEETLIRQRREAAGLTGEELEKPLIGLGISGGGIRSATFALGVFQSLCRAGLLPKVDYLSTVSGGGYFGGFLGRMLTRADIKSPGTGIEQVQREVMDSRSPPLRWLRENGRYLAPNGAGDVQTGLAVALRNWLATQFVMGGFFFAAFACACWMQRETLLRHPQSWPPGEWADWLTPSAILPVGALLVFVVPLCGAYWLIPERSIASIVPPLAAVAALATGGVAIWTHSLQAAIGFCSLAMGVSMGGSILWLLLLYFWTSHVVGDGSLAGRLQRLQFMRNRASDWLGWSLACALALMLFAALDAGGNWLSRLHAEQWGRLWSFFGGLLTALGSLASAAHKLLAILGPKPGQPAIRHRGVDLLLHVAALTLALTLLLFISFLAHLACEFSAQWTAIAAVFVSLALGRTQRLANRSSFEPLYQARLTRAYLGASNPDRLTRPENSDVTDVIPGDGILWAEYHPHRSGGPLHLINVTLNETVGGRSNIEQLDRKGLAMAVGPCGISVGARHHALWAAERSLLTPIGVSTGYSIFKQRGGQPIRPESLDLGHWLAISGAAVSTGAGAHTDVGLSLLCGLANARLGYWWDSGVLPRRRVEHGVQGAAKRLARLFALVFPVQASLLDEWAARFHGPSRRLWNLSDGGHFENLAGYELIRRELPLIIVIDGEQDGSYAFSGLANLIRKARIDFGAEIRFLPGSELDARIGWPARRHFGTLEDLKPSRRAVGRDAGRAVYSRASAAVAEIRYAASKTGTLVYIKACLTGLEPTDVLQYKEEHADFPHESTAEQFFAESQWESYRRLGEFHGQCVLEAAFSLAP